jgi:DNA-binding protein HU-beta
VSEIFNSAASSSRLKPSISVFLDTLSNLAYKAIKKNGEFVLPGFGKLVQQKRKARTGVNPRHNKKSRFQPRPSSNSESPRQQRTPFSG